MLKKLVKYEVKCTKRYLAPMLSILLIYSCISKLILSLDIFGDTYNIIAILLTMTYYLVTICFVVSTFLINAFRFYKSMVTDEAYQTFSVPVDIEMLTLSKLITAVLSNAISFLAVTLSGIVMFSNGKFFQYYKMFIEQIKAFTQQLNINVIVIVVFIAVVLILTFGMYNLYIQAAIAIGQSFSNNKIGFTFLSGIFLYFMMNILLMIGILLISFFADMETVGYYLYFCIFFIIYLVTINFLLNRITNLFFKSQLNLE